MTRPKYHPDSQCGHYSVHCHDCSGAQRSSDYPPASAHRSAGRRCYPPTAGGVWPMFSGPTPVDSASSEWTGQRWTGLGRAGRVMSRWTTRLVASSSQPWPRERHPPLDAPRNNMSRSGVYLVSVCSKTEDCLSGQIFALKCEMNMFSWLVLQKFNGCYNCVTFYFLKICNKLSRVE